MTYTLQSLGIPAALSQFLYEGGWGMPKATLTAPASAGSLTLSVSDVRSFLSGVVLRFWDGLGETSWAVDSNTPSDQMLSATPVPGTLTLSAVGMTTDGRPYSSPLNGLAYTHSTGAAITTNLLVNQFPVDVEAMLGNNWPVWSFFSLDRKDELGARGEALRGWLPHFKCSAIYQLPAKPPTGSGIHAQIFTEQQIDRAEKDIDRFRRDLMRNTVLANSDHIQHAEDLITFESSLRNNIQNQLFPLWEMYVDITIRGMTDYI